jgi:hypothetical protein
MLSYGSAGPAIVTTVEAVLLGAAPFAGVENFAGAAVLSGQRENGDHCERYQLPPLHSVSRISPVGTGIGNKLR